MTFWLLIPIKSLQAGKSRLSPFLSDQARRCLNEFFLRHIVKVATEFPGSQRTAIISDCEEVLNLAKSLDIYTIRQTGGSGLNRAATQGVDQLRALGADEILVIASDLPFIRSSDIRELAAIDMQHRVVICPDRKKAGTNALLLRGGASLRFNFGEESYKEHLHAAMRIGAPPIIYVNRRVAIDIDVAEGLELWINRSSAIANDGRDVDIVGLSSDEGLEALGEVLTALQR
jgi:2-phospho-L-lactate guanylyltransferase